MNYTNELEAIRGKENEEEIRYSGWQLLSKECKRVKEWMVKAIVFLYSSLEVPNSDTDKFESGSDWTVGKSLSIDPGGYPYQVWT